MNPMLSSPEIQGFEKRGVSKKPGFMPQQYRNHSQPVALQRLKGSIFYPEPKFPCPVFIWRIVL